MKSRSDLWNSNRLKPILFLLVGGFTALLYFFIFLFLYYYCQVGYIFAVTVGYFVSTAFHFNVNRNLTFQAQNGNKAQQLRNYLILLGINYCITITIIYIAIALRLPPYFSNLAAIILTIVINYFFCNFYIFRKVSILTTSKSIKE